MARLKKLAQDSLKVIDKKKEVKLEKKHIFNKHVCEYHYNSPMYGIKTPWDVVNKNFKKMMKDCNAPDGLYDPTEIPWDEVNWSVLMSERSSSKTTQLLLYFMTANRVTGQKLVYVRKRSDQLTQSMYINLFNVITDSNYGYIKHLTGGLYDNVYIDRTTKECFYGTKDEHAMTPFMTLMNIQEYSRYLSTFNATDHDFIILDEFSHGVYTPDEFLHFCQIIATLRRERVSVKICLLSNTISPFDMYLRELGISKHLARVKRGVPAIITSELGTKVYCKLLDVAMHKTEAHTRRALEYFGFENENLRQIYGGEWEIKGFKHLPKENNVTLKKTNILLDCMGNYLALYSFNKGKMVGMFVAPFTKDITEKMKEKIIVVTDKPHFDTELLNISSMKVAAKLWDIDKTGLLYFADNECGLEFNALMESLRLTKQK